MTLQEVSDISQTVAAIAVVVSLVFIVVQLRMNAEQQREANTLARIQVNSHLTSQMNAHTSRLMDRDVATMFRKVMVDKVDLNPVEATQMLTYFNLVIREHSLAYIALEEGLFSKQDLDTMDSFILWFLTAPLFAKEWERLKRFGLFPEPFVEHINRRFAERYPVRVSPVDPPAPESSANQTAG